MSAVEKEYLLEYCSLVREGKTNYISTHSFHDITGRHSMEPVDFFKTYAVEFKPKKKRTLFIYFILVFLVLSSPRDM